MKNTIDDLLKILQSAKEELGGEFYFCIYNREGESIKVSGLDFKIVSRGYNQFEELYFV